MANTIRIFISSPFNDMQLERDVIVKKIFPRLRFLAEQRGVSFSYVDLRWGITPGTDTYTIISTCLTEIENCHPFFIGLLGSDYGTWIPEVTNEEEKELGERFTGVNDFLKHKLGLTEIEMRYNLLYSKNVNSNLFCFRKSNESRNTEDKRQSLLNDLKNYLEDNYAPIVRYYDPLENYQDTESFEKTIYDYFKKIIDEEFPEVENVESRFVRLNQQYFLETMTSSMQECAVNKELEDWFLKMNLPPIFLLYGSLGLGKTYILGDFIRKHSEVCCYHFIGRSQKIETPSLIIDDIIDQLEERLGISQSVTRNSSIDDKMDHLATLYDKLGEQDSLIVVLDGIDNIVCPVSEHVSFLYSLPFHDKVRYIVSSEDINAPTLYCSMLSVYPFQIRPLSKDEIIAYADNYLFTLYKKKLENKYKEVLVNNDLLSVPLNLSLFLDEISTLGGYSFLNPESLSLIKSTESIVVSRIKRIEQIIPVEKVKTTLSLLSVSDNSGILEDDFYIICNFFTAITREEWSIIYCNIFHLLESCRYLVINDTIQSAIVGYYDCSLTDVRNRLADSLRKLHNSSDYLLEILHQYYFSGNTRELSDVIATPEAFMSLYTDNRDILTKYLLKVKEEGLINTFYDELSLAVCSTKNKKIISGINETVALFFSNELPIYKLALNAITTAINECLPDNKTLLKKLNLEKVEILISDYQLDVAAKELSVLEKDGLVPSIAFEILKAKERLFSSNPDIAVKSLASPVICELLFNYSKKLSISYYFDLVYNYLSLMNANVIDYKNADMNDWVMGETYRITKMDPYKMCRIYSHDYFSISMNKIEYSYYHENDKSYPKVIGIYDDYLNQLYQLADKAKQIYGRNSKDYLGCLFKIAAMCDRKCDTLYKYNQYDDYCEAVDMSLDYYREISDVTKMIYQRDSYEYARSLHGLAWRIQCQMETRPLNFLFDFKECCTLYTEIEKILNSIFSNGCELIARCYHNMAGLFLEIHDFYRAKLMIVKSLNMKGKLTGGSSRTLFNSVLRLNKIMIDEYIYADSIDMDSVKKCEQSIREYMSSESVIKSNNREERVNSLSEQLDILHTLQENPKNCYLKVAMDKLQVINKSTRQIRVESKNLKDDINTCVRYYIILVNEWRNVEDFVNKKNILDELKKNENYIMSSREVNEIYNRVNSIRTTLKLDPNWDTVLKDMLL